ncbi:hypothetical protein [Bosea sp. (in: a-proteobacteria)]|uniref:hypothetical protein n=1 Tax=Bosea sp. (in: a-proteobacteria) TaxID=1871050 RepID=UPI001AD1B0E8|nr:hypothetical protein [Bosea sp. (in: a-proteobacteria)]MBN9437861.1 hypothetical protein [Bosea sp. (in: a-proteobacteria)]
MSGLETLRRRLALWLGEALPAAPRRLDQPSFSVDDEAQRRSVRQVTLKQISITHWSCHTLY